MYNMLYVTYYKKYTQNNFKKIELYLLSESYDVYLFVQLCLINMYMQ